MYYKLDKQEDLFDKVGPVWSKIRQDMQHNRSYSIGIIVNLLPEENDQVKEEHWPPYNWYGDAKCLNCGKIGHMTWTPIGDYCYSPIFNCSSCGERGEVKNENIFTVTQIWHEAAP